MATLAELAHKDYRRNLGDGLLMRWSTAADTAHLSDVVGRIFRESESSQPHAFLQQLVTALMSGSLLTMGPGDYALVEDRGRQGNPIVAGICLQRHVMEYDGVPFGFGRPEIVFAEPAYRNRGLIRLLFELIHARSEVEGHLVQGITGIPYFYRQFGYEYALDLAGRYILPISVLPPIKEGEQAAYQTRIATADDIPIIHELYQFQRSRYLVSTTLSEQYWYSLLEGWKDTPEQLQLTQIHLILDQRQTVLGLLEVRPRRGKNYLNVEQFITAPGVNLPALLPSLLRTLVALNQQMAATDTDVPPFYELSFQLGQSHPVYDLLQHLAHKTIPPYAWYIRVPDLPRFVRHIAPVLERRLVDSPVAGYTGNLKLNLHRGGLQLIFNQGHLQTVENWRAPLYEHGPDGADGGFPPLVFLKSLFGYKSLNELCNAYPDVYMDQNQLLFKTLFPVKPSSCQFLIY